MDAHRILGDLYRHGHLGQRDLDQAREHYEVVRGQGDADATYNLGLLCKEQAQK